MAAPLDFSFSLYCFHGDFVSQVSNHNKLSTYKPLPLRPSGTPPRVHREIDQYLLNAREKNKSLVTAQPYFTSVIIKSMELMTDF